MLFRSEGTTNSDLNHYISKYKQIRLVHQLLFNNFGKEAIPIIHACAGFFMVLFLFNIIFFNVTTDPFFMTQMCFCLAITVFAFKVISKNICDYTEATEEFLNSYSKVNMPEMSEVNEYELKALAPIKVEVKPLMTYERVTFGHILQEIVMANTIDLLLAAGELNVKV